MYDWIYFVRQAEHESKWARIAKKTALLDANYFIASKHISSCIYHEVLFTWTTRWPSGKGTQTRRNELLVKGNLQGMVEGITIGKRISFLISAGFIDLITGWMKNALLTKVHVLHSGPMLSTTTIKVSKDGLIARCGAQIRISKVQHTISEDV